MQTETETDGDTERETDRHREGDRHIEKDREERDKDREERQRQRETKRGRGESHICPEHRTPQPLTAPRPSQCHNHWYPLQVRTAGPTAGSPAVPSSQGQAKEEKIT